MKATLVPGVSTTPKITVDEPRTIAFLGEEDRVYSTPSMVRDVECTALQLVGEHLDEGESSVGTHVSMDHLGATPLGAWVEVQESVVEPDGVADDFGWKSISAAVRRVPSHRLSLPLTRWT